MNEPVFSGDRNTEKNAFSEFFKRATHYSPYPYQVNFAFREKFPKVLIAPTGSGKTETVIVGWLWKRKYAPEHIRARTPRRLVYCLPVRVLVEQTFERVKKILEKLGLKDDVKIAMLMGGEDDSDWYKFPEKDEIIVGTQDMLLSRALNRGYGMSRYLWPMHYALLNNDCLWVMDEVQLMGVGLETSVQLQAFREKWGCIGNTCTIWMSATLDKERLKTVDAEEITEEDVLTLSPEDIQREPLKRIYTAPKYIQKFSPSENGKLIDELASHIVTNHQENTLTLVIVNTVKDAQKLYEEVKKEIKKAEKKTRTLPHLILLHSRFRLPERKEKVSMLLGTAVDGVQTSSPSRNLIAITTQVVEAGVDVSAARLYTELAPWSSLVQRFGRCNRRGEFQSATIVWFELSSQKKDYPYSEEELTTARTYLEELRDGGNVSLENLEAFMSQKTFSPAQHAPMVLRTVDILDLFDTTPDLSGNDLDVSRFVREIADTDVYVFWRDIERMENSKEYTPPHREELCCVPFYEIRKHFKDLKNFVRLWNPLKGSLEKIEKAELIFPGQVLLLDCKAGRYDENVGWNIHRKNLVNELSFSGKASVIEEEDIYESDALTYIRRKVSLKNHIEDVKREITTLSSFLSLSENERKILYKAAEWHDMGKSHEVFQKALRRPALGEDTAEGEILAKSDYFGKYERKHFRHEVASALGWLRYSETHEPEMNLSEKNLVAYLVVSHHGKVHFLLRSFPDERLEAGGIYSVKGIREGDEIRVVNGGRLTSLRLDFSYLKFGEGSWTERMFGLRDNPSFGPFRLAYYGTLLRIADWRASQKEAEVSWDQKGENREEASLQTHGEKGGKLHD